MFKKEKHFHRSCSLEGHLGAGLVFIEFGLFALLFSMGGSCDHEGKFESIWREWEDGVAGLGWQSGCWPWLCTGMMGCVMDGSNL